MTTQPKLTIEDGWIIDPPDELLAMEPQYQVTDTQWGNRDDRIHPIEKCRRLSGYVIQDGYHWKHCRVSIDEAIRVGWSHPDLEWIEPTDEDAKHRPEVEVWDYETSEKVTGILVFVRKVGSYGFTVAVGEDQGIGIWKHCRMRADAPHRIKP